MSTEPVPEACQCRSACRCAREPGPVVWEVTRAGERLRVCTRCTLVGDTDKVRVGHKELLNGYLAYDYEGAVAAFAEDFDVLEQIAAAVAAVGEIARRGLEQEEEDDEP